MRRWRVVSKIGDAEVVRVVGAETQTKARNHERVEGDVISVSEVIPDVTWRDPPGGYYFTAQIRGRRYCEALDTSDARIARERAGLKRGAIEAERWTDLEKTRAKRCWSTVGALLDAYEAICRECGRPARRTVEENVRSLARIVRVTRGGDPRDVSCGELTGRLLRDYLSAELPEEEDAEPGEADRTRRSVAAAVAHARSVVPPGLAGRYEERGVTLPNLTSFRGERICEAPRVDRSDPPEAEVAALLQAAGRLPAERPDLWTVWVLAYDCGMRVREIQACRWTWFRERDGRMWVEIRRRPEEFFEPKGTSGWTYVNKAAWAALSAMPRTWDPWVVRGGSDARARSEGRDTQSRDLIEREFAEWMRAIGWSGPHCAHDLRYLRGVAWYRAFGSECRERWLRHARPSVVAAYSDGYFNPWGAAGAVAAVE
jgi:integrase